MTILDRIFEAIGGAAVGAVIMLLLIMSGWV